MQARAMILAAGRGARLSPLSDNVPKALIKYDGKPMLEHIIMKLINAGVQDIIINVHHHAEQIISYVEDNNMFGISIEFSHETKELLDTGGGIYNARWFFEGKGAFIVYNIDIHSSIDIAQLLETHNRGERLVTLAVKQRDTSRNFLMNEKNVLSGWKNNQTGEVIITREDKNLVSTAFSGIHVISDAIFPLIEREGPFSITNAYLELSKDHSIYLYDHSNDHWTDMAHPNNFPGLLK